MSGRVVTRRSALRILGAGAGSVAVLPWLSEEGVAAFAEPSGMHLQFRRQAAELDFARGVGGRHQDPEMARHDHSPFDETCGAR